MIEMVLAKLFSAILRGDFTSREANRYHAASRPMVLSVRK